MLLFSLKFKTRVHITSILNVSVYSVQNCLRPVGKDFANLEKRNSVDFNSYSEYKQEHEPDCERISQLMVKSTLASGTPCRGFLYVPTWICPLAPGPCTLEDLTAVYQIAKGVASTGEMKTSNRNNYPTIFYYLIQFFIYYFIF